MPIAGALAGGVWLLLSVVLLTGLLWLGSRWWSTDRIPLRRAVIAACVICSGVGVAALLLVMSAPLKLVLLAALLSVAIVWASVKWSLRMPAGRAAAVSMVMLLLYGVPQLVVVGMVMHFVIQGYNVPTGAMAPAIFGAHADVTCENCGMQYAVSMSDRVVDSPWSSVEPLPVVCPNCGQPADVPVDATILKGDRILVDKTRQPRRWEPALFTSPRDQKTRFVKRLVGLPGETLELLGGDVFADGRRLQKPPAAAAEMWLLVHDTRFVPARPSASTARWQPGSKTSFWKPAGAGWTFDDQPSAADEDQQDQELVFTGQILDRLAWNGAEDEFGEPPSVGDVRIELRIERFSGDGVVRFRRTFRGQTVSAVVSADGAASIHAHDSTEDSEIKPPALGTIHGQPFTGFALGQRLAFAYRDGAAYLTCDDQLIASALIGSQDLESEKRRLEGPAEPCEIGISAGGPVSFSWITVERDVYYRSAQEMGGMAGSGMECFGCTDHPLHLGPDDYYLLGDNSSRSLDARFWGPVHGDAIRGVVRSVYWPTNRWRTFQD